MSPEKISIIFGAVFGAVGLFLFIRFLVLKIRRRSLVIARDTLSFFVQYTYYGNYSNEERVRPQYLDKILDVFRIIIKPEGSISIESKFNKINYAVFDLDSREQYNLFKKIYSASSYAIFQSSHEHYWAILDYPYEKISEIFIEPNWKVCNDQNYVSFSMNQSKMLIRGLYENFERKPNLYETNGNLSKNFQLFIDKLYFFYNKEGLELSVLRYKDPTMLIKFNRRRKLQQLKNFENEGIY